jgi:signal transduction histidine kinase
MVNRAGMRLFDAQEKKILGRSLYDHLTHENDVRLSILMHQLQNQITISDVEIQFKTIEGDIKWVLLSAFADGLHGEVLVSLMDITRQKEIDIAKTEFVTLASHQLRTPIAAVRWNLELLQSTHTDLTETQQLYYTKVNKNVERLASLVNDFLHVSKLELGTFASSPQEVVLSTFIHNTLEEFDKSIQDKKLTIDTSFEPDELVARLDPRLLRIILDNLVSNAVKYTGTEGTIAVSYRASAQEVVVAVSDTGIGIPADEIRNMFNRFYRASNAEKQHAEGTGLGLYIIKQAVKIMQGEISVQSTLGKGTTFTLRLPL